jgi:mRNA interferase RelE/StbE
VLVNSYYLLRVPDAIASLIQSLHPQIKSHVKLALKAILEDPHCGKALKEELHGLRSYRVKKYRIIYRIVSQKKEMEIIAIGPRRNIYEETFKIISRSQQTPD